MVYTLKANMKDEFQRLVIIGAIANIAREGEMTKIMQEDRCFAWMHGTPGEDGDIGLLENLINGRGVFGQLFQEKEMFDSKTGETVILLKVKDEFTQDPGLNVVCGNGAIELTNINQTNLKGGGLLRGRTALDKVSKAKNAALSNCKKAIAFGESILEGPSGKKREDWIKEVLDRILKAPKWILGIQFLNFMVLVSGF